MLEPEKGYYRNSPIKPGFLFFDSLLRAPRVSIENLEVNIPDMMYYSDAFYYIKNKENGRLTVRSDFSLLQFMKSLRTVSREEEEAHPFERIPVVVRSMSYEM